MNEPRFIPFILFAFAQHVHNRSSSDRSRPQSHASRDNSTEAITATTVMYCISDDS